MPWKTMCPNLAGFGEEFYSSGPRAELLRISVCAGSALLSSGLRWSPDELVLLLFSCQVVSLCDLMGCSTPGFPVFHYLLEFAQTHVHWVSDAIQPSHPLLSSSPPALNLSQQLGLFQWVDVLHHVARVLELQPQSFGGYRTVTFSGVKSADIFHLLGVFVLWRGQRYCYMYPMRGNPDRVPRLHSCLLAAPPLSLHPLPSLTSSCSDLLSGTHRRLWRLASLPHKQEAGDTESFHVQEPHRVLLGFSTSWGLVVLARPSCPVPAAVCFFLCSQARSLLGFQTRYCACVQWGGSHFPLFSTWQGSATVLSSKSSQSEVALAVLVRALPALWWQARSTGMNLGHIRVRGSLPQLDTSSSDC